MKTVLNVGCGGTEIHPQFKGWKETRLDIDPVVKPDIVCDMRDMSSTVFSGAYAAVYSSHTLEHLYYHEVPVALSEFYRVLNLGGIVFIGVPNLRAIAEIVARGNLEGILYESPGGPISAIDCIYGSREFLKNGNPYQLHNGNPYQLHKTGFTPGTLTKKLKAAGFVEIQVDTQNTDMWVSGVKK